METCVARVLLLVSYKYTTSHPSYGKGDQNADGGPPKPIHGTTWHVSLVYKRVSPSGARAGCSGVPVRSGALPPVAIPPSKVASQDVGRGYPGIPRRILKVKAKNGLLSYLSSAALCGFFFVRFPSFCFS